jgi:hypothetical protein
MTPPQEIFSLFMLVAASLHVCQKKCVKYAVADSNPLYVFILEPDRSPLGPTLELSPGEPPSLSSKMRASNCDRLARSFYLLALKSRHPPKCRKMTPQQQLFPLSMKIPWHQVLQVGS